MGLVHSLSLFGKPAPANDTERQLLDLMSNYKFNVMGSMRSMDNFLHGFSIAFMLPRSSWARSIWRFVASGLDCSSEWR